VTSLKWKLVSVHLEIVLIMTQDRCTICVERVMGSKSFWMLSIELLADVGHVESLFFSFGTVSMLVQDRCIVCVKHTIGLEIVLDAPDGTLR
jgi:hypothetical protein